MLQVENGHDLKSDIYQIGVLTYEMLCGLPPFYDAVDTKKMFESIQNSPVILPSWISS
jgi:serine/threonine protein kinase